MNPQGIVWVLYNVTCEWIVARATNLSRALAYYNLGSATTMTSHTACTRHKNRSNCFFLRLLGDENHYGAYEYVLYRLAMHGIHSKFNEICLHFPAAYRIINWSIGDFNLFS